MGLNSGFKGLKQGFKNTQSRKLAISEKFYLYRKVGSIHLPFCFDLQSHTVQQHQVLKPVSSLFVME